MSHETDASEAVADPDRDAMLRLFEEEPGDLAAYGVMADRMDELGYANIAHAYRWMSLRGKYPHRRERYCSFSGRSGRKVPDQFRWAWYEESPHRTQTAGSLPVSPLALHSLPRLVIPGEQKVFGSHAAAVMALAGWLKRLRDAYDVEPPKTKGL